jgi:hypothetical protein
MSYAPVGAKGRPGEGKSLSMVADRTKKATVGSNTIPSSRRHRLPRPRLLIDARANRFLTIF